VEGSVTKTLGLLVKNHPDLEDEINRLKKADEYTKKSITALRALREHVINQIQQNES
jgi:hypothetical protein